MKRLGIFLVGLILLAGGLNATTTADTTKVAISDSVKELYLNDDLDPKEAILLQKLNPSQLMDLERLRMDSEGRSDMPFTPFGILLICLSPFVMVILIVYFSMRESSKRGQRRYDISMKALELGQPLPQSFFDEPKKRGSRLQSGLVWMGVGIGLVIAGLFSDEEELFTVGIVPAFVGLGILIAYFVEKPKNDAANNTPSVNE